MSGPIVLDSLDLAALLCSRVCHDLISPVGAIANGLEVLDEAKDEETRTFALDLIKKSARQGSARLQFCRLAFGAAGSAGAQIDTGDAEKVSRGFLEDDKTKIEWSVPRELLPKNRVKLLLNLLLIAQQTIPRGGVLSVASQGTGEAMTFKIGATGLNARIPKPIPALLAGGHGETIAPAGQGDGGTSAAVAPAVTPAIDAHAIQPFYAGALARACNLAVSIAAEDGGVVITAG